MGITFSREEFRKTLLAVFSAISVTGAAAQADVKFLYLDTSLINTTKEKAFYISEITKENNTFRKTRYLAQSKKIVHQSFYLDSGLARPTGLSVEYYEGGQLKDSVEFDTKSKKINAFHYYANGQLICHYTPEIREEDIEGFDESGKKITGFIYEREAEFRGGNKAWTDYLHFKLRNNNFAKKGAPFGEYRVIVRFVINKKGELTSIQPLTSHGYGMEEEVMNVIKNAPKWKPAILLNKPVMAYRRQPITVFIEL